MSIASRIFKKMCTRSDALRDKGLTVPENVTLIENLSYGPDSKWHTLDVCYPKDKPSSATVINVHGGGYVYGSTTPYKFYCCDLAARGFTVVSFNYRLAPKHKFPSPLEDLNLVMQWVLDHTADYPLDPENILMVGDSAGAQLASQYAVIWSNPEYAGIMGITPPEFRFAAVGLNCGMYDLLAHTTSDKRLAPIVRDYFTGKPERFGEKLNVLKYINSSFPPAYLISAPGDFLAEKCQPMAELLTSRGVECEYRLYGDKTTGHVFHINIRSELADEANTDQLAFMMKYVRSS
ncbi:MAG: alpha/beta hydrolase [Ruminococcaceae bacterium]|nr:alpha/beta hydrolase [Oscillospiraceae bacterium]